MYYPDVATIFHPGCLYYERHADLLIPFPAFGCLCWSVLGLITSQRHKMDLLGQQSPSLSLSTKP